MWQIHQLSHSVETLKKDVLELSEAQGVRKRRASSSQLDVRPDAPNSAASPPASSSRASAAARTAEAASGGGADAGVIAPSAQLQTLEARLGGLEERLAAGADEDDRREGQEEAAERMQLQLDRIEARMARAVEASQRRARQEQARADQLQAALNRLEDASVATAVPDVRPARSPRTPRGAGSNGRPRVRADGACLKPPSSSFQW